MSPRTMRRRLAKDFPLSRRVVVTFEECQEDDTIAESWIDGKVMRINISPALSEPEKVHALLHEWAHLLHWQQIGRQVQYHSVNWAKLYAQLYNRYVSP
jgi:predicted SprT family Zn-dependent metalloprotease